MIRKPVQSSAIASVGYDEELLLLDIEFTSGALWRYQGVRPDHYDSLINAPSIGKRFHTHIKGCYEATRLPDALRLWVVGLNRLGEAWDLVGLFTTLELAIEACVSPRCFVGPQTVDVALSMDTEEWEGSFYPSLHPDYAHRYIPLD